MGRLSAAEVLFDDREGNLWAVLPDAVASEGPHRIGNFATEQEVETGAAVTDHVRAESDTLELELVFSDTPIRALEGDPEHVFFGVEGAVQSVDLEGRRGVVLTAYSERDRGPTTEERDAEGSKAQMWQPDGEEITRVRDSWDLLTRARDGAWLASIITDLRTYESMVLLSAETTRTAVDGTWIRVRCVFRQIRRVSTQLVDAPEPARARDRAQQRGGRQPTEETDAATQPRVSGLATLFGLGG